jgi:ABC-type nitrate/sulfonate/bicarbonate transport system substrate-binding protein
MNTEGTEIEVTYDKDFNEDDISDRLLKFLVDVRRKPDLSRETFLRLLHQWGWMPEDFDVEEEMDRIRNEQRSNPAFTSLAQRLNPEE